MLGNPAILGLFGGLPRSDAHCKGRQFESGPVHELSLVETRFHEETGFLSFDEEGTGVHTARKASARRTL